MPLGLQSKSYDIATDFLPSLRCVVSTSYDIATDILEPHPDVRTKSCNIGKDIWDIGSRSAPTFSDIGTD
eukprot:12408654-Karenia_brevis.AAC.1